MQELSAEERIVAILRLSGPATASELAEVMGDAGSVVVALHKLTKLGVVTYKWDFRKNMRVAYEIVE